jgi:CheY-like chemotaxis protein
MNRVLIVDDEQIHLRSTAALLERAGFATDTALGGEEALEKLAEKPFDSVLVDLMMPRMNGLELVRTIRERHSGLRVVLTSSFPLSARQVERMGLGDVPFVPKPCPGHELAAALTVERALPSDERIPMAHLTPPSQPAHGSGDPRR